MSDPTNPPMRAGTAGVMTRRSLLLSLPGLAVARRLLAQQASPLRIGGLHQVTLAVSDLERSLDFYQAVFGMPVQAREDGKIILRIGNGPHFLALTEAGSGQPHIDHFGLRFMSEDFEWHDEWDSSQLEQAGELPRAAEIEVAFLDVNPDDLEAADGLGGLGLSEGEGETTRYTRRVALPMQAIDLAAMLDEAAADAFAQELSEAEAEQAAEKEAAAAEGAGDDEGKAGDPDIRIDLSAGGSGGRQ